MAFKASFKFSDSREFDVLNWAHPINQGENSLIL